MEARQYDSKIEQMICTSHEQNVHMGLSIKPELCMQIGDYEKNRFPL